MKPFLPPKALELVQWHEARRDGSLVGYEGLLVEHVKHPYHVDIDKRGNWQLWHFDGHDDSKIVSKGSANNVDAAKLAATGAALQKIPSLREYATPEQNQLPRDIPQNGHVTNLRRTLRLYGAVSALILWLGFATYWFFKARPVVATLAVMLLVGALWITHNVLEYLERVNGRREKLLKQQTAQAIVSQSKQQALVKAGR